MKIKAILRKNDKNFEIDKRNMVENFRYKGYNGDANNPKYGQAVIKRK